MESIKSPVRYSEANGFPLVPIFNNAQRKHSTLRLVASIGRHCIKTKLIGLLVCSLLITTSFSLVIHAEDNQINLGTKGSDITDAIMVTGDGDILDQYNTEVSGDVLVDSGCWYSESWKYAQSFTPSFTILTRIEIYMYKSGNGGWRSYTAEIKNTINGSNLTYALIEDCWYLPHEDSWIEFDFPDINVVPGQTYYLVLTPGECYWSLKFYFLLYYGQPDPYSRGEAWYLLEPYQQYNPYNQSWVKFERNGTPTDFCFKTYGINLPPNQPSKPTGNLSGTAGEEYTYSSSTDDPEQRNISYWFDWGDGTNSGWIGPYQSGTICEASHIWSHEGSYSIVVKAKDEYDEESAWSDPLSIAMPKNNPINAHFIRFLETLPYLFRLFQQFQRL